MQKTLSALTLCLAVLTLSGCQKSAADVSSGTYTGGNLTVFQDSMLFAKPGGAAVTVSGIDGGTITVRMDSLLTGFPSVTATCTAEKDGSGSDAKVYFAGEGKASSYEIIKINGSASNGRMSLNFKDSVISFAVGKWMLDEYTYETVNPRGSITVPNFTFDVDFDFSLISPEQVSALVTPLVTGFLSSRSPYFDNIEFAANGKIGINYTDYHAEAVLPRDSVNAIWEQSIAGLGTVGQFVSTGHRGLLHYYQGDSECGTSLPNTLIALANALLDIEEIPLQIPIPFIIPFTLNKNGEKMELTIDQTVLNPVLEESRDTINTLLESFTYADFIGKIPEPYKEYVRQKISEDTFGDVKLIIRLAINDILLDENTTYSIKLSLIPYKKVLRPWEQ